MSMDYISAVLQSKRGREGDHDEWDVQAKRLCNGLERCVQVEYGALTQSPMDTINNHHISSKVLATQNGSSPQCCPRCMAGEPVLMIKKHAFGRVYLEAGAADGPTRYWVLIGCTLAEGHINHIMQRY